MIQNMSKNRILILLSILFLSFLMVNSVSAVQDNNKVLFDETGPYGKYFTIYNLGPYGASTFANLLQDNGFSVYRTTESPLTYSKIKDYEVLILMAPERNYSSQEIKDIKRYVSEGGGLFLLGDGWGAEDGNENYAYNTIAQSFGVEFSYNALVVDPNHYMAYTYYIKVTNISSHPLTSGISEFYFMLGPYLKQTGNSTILAYSDTDSWADNMNLTSEGYSENNELKESEEPTGPLPLLATEEYGKGRIVFFGAVTTFSNTFLYRSNGWKLGLNSVNWLSGNPIPAAYNKSDLFSPTLGDLSYKIMEMILITVVLLVLLVYLIRRDKKRAELRPVRTIKNWKYNGLMLFNGIFIAIGAILFFYMTYSLSLFDISQIDYYDPFLGYALLITGILFIFFAGLTLYNIFHRLRIVANYSYINLVIILLFASLTTIFWEIFPYPTVSDFTLESLVLLIPSLVNLWMIRSNGPDLIIEGKEFNRLEKLSSKSLPYELHSIYTDSAYIGEGGFGRVFKAKRKDEAEVAIKIPKTFDKRSEKIFISEVSNWEHLVHPNIVRLFDFKILPIPYIEMEYCEKAVEHGKKPLKEALKIIYETAKGLQYAHQKNIIHGDVKTSNLMMNKGVYKISDWGLSKVKTGESITLSGATPQYAAPEQISHQFGKADERTDIYQLGTVFYELVTGDLPFKGEMAEVYGSILNTQPIVPSKINPEAAEVEKIIMKCLNKNKDDRYSSMGELINDLEEFYHPIKLDETVMFQDEGDNV